MTAHEDICETINTESKFEYPGAPLFPHEYVVARINIKNTLAGEFYAHANYDKTPGTFPVNCKEAARRAWHLIYEFLDEYKLPQSEDLPQTWVCPRFVPRDHLVYIRRVYPSRAGTYGADLYTVEVAPFGTPIECSNIYRLNVARYVPLNSTSSEREYSLSTEQEFLSKYSLFQDLYLVHPSLICSAKDSTSRRRLDAHSQEAFELLQNMARPNVERLYAQRRAEQSVESTTPSSCGCQSHHLLAPKSPYYTATYDDIVFDFDYSAVSDYGIKSHLNLSLEFEVDRMMAIIDDWMVWFTTRQFRRQVHRSPLHKHDDNDQPEGLQICTNSSLNHRKDIRD
jgi:hypothetical protein